MKLKPGVWGEGGGERDLAIARSITVFPA